MPAPAPAHLISRAADPVFALLIGLGAAATRIHREEKEAGRGGWATIETGLRRTGLSSKSREGQGKGEGEGEARAVGR
ncbi:hypothetical protein PZA11_003491 [Diplocarpon coronariae]